MTTTAPDPKVNDPIKKERKKRTPSSWVVLTRQSGRWHFNEPVTALSRKAAISDIIAKTRSEGNDEMYVAIPSDQWNPVKVKIEQPPPVITLEAAK